MESYQLIIGCSKFDLHDPYCRFMCTKAVKQALIISDTNSYTLDAFLIMHDNSSWPLGVTSLEDMHRYSETLFGNCIIENLLTDMDFDGHPGCHFIRVKGACNQGDWMEYPGLINEAMKATVETYERPDIIQVKSKVAGAPSGTPV